MRKSLCRVVCLAACAYPTGAVCQSVSVVSLSGPGISLAPGASTTVVVGLRNESVDESVSILASNLSLATTALGGGSPGGVSIANVVPADGALFGENAPLVIPMPDQLLVSIGPPPPPEPTVLGAESVAPLFAVEVSADAMASGDYALVFDPFMPPAAGSSYLVGPPPVPTSFVNPIDPGIGGRSLIVTLSIVPEASSAAAAMCCLLLSGSARRPSGG